MKNKENDKKKQMVTGLVNILTGVCLIFFSLFMRGTDIKDFIAGLMAGLACGIILVGVYVISRTIRR